MNDRSCLLFDLPNESILVKLATCWEGRGRWISYTDVKRHELRGCWLVILIELHRDALTLAGDGICMLLHIFFLTMIYFLKKQQTHTDAISSNYVYIFYIAPMVLHQNLLNSKNQSEPHRHGEISTWRNSAMFWGSGDRALLNWCEKSSGAEWDV